MMTILLIYKNHVKTADTPQLRQWSSSVQIGDILYWLGLSAGKLPTPTDLQILPRTPFSAMFEDIALKVTIIMVYNDKYDLQCNSQPSNMKITNP